MLVKYSNFGRLWHERNSAYIYYSSDSDLEFNLGGMNHLLKDS